MSNMSVVLRTRTMLETIIKLSKEDIELVYPLRITSAPFTSEKTKH